MYSIKETIMRRDGLSGDEADKLIDDAARKLRYYLDENDMLAAMDICEEFFGLEPDYIMDLMERL